ncbi:MAG: hypothetical protein QXR87_04710 [Candidatus Hadarchaeales archaeon]
MRGNDGKIRAIQEKLLQWFERNGRDFPWRKTKDPYRILIAEIMLQRTKAEQVVPVYKKFIGHFPSPESLAKARTEAVRAFFSRLGLLWRADLVVRLAGELVKKFGGTPPSERKELLSLPGVGDYMADAVLSFAYGADVAVVDSNVCRVLRRIFDIRPKGEARRDRRFRELAMRLVPHGKSREFNWAMIDFASEICTPQKPKCGKCPLRYHCSAATNS